MDCDSPAGYGAEVGDCDDADADIHPGARERCDDVDEDCDGEIDEDAVDATTWYGDEDGDGYGSEEGTALCDPPADSIADHSDCDDANELVYPGAPGKSYLMHKLDGTHLDAGGQGVQMPFGAPPLEPEVRERIRAWIAAGALNN